MSSSEFDKGFRIWLLSDGGRHNRDPAVRWLATDVATGVVWLNSTDPKVTDWRCRAIKAYAIDPFGYRLHARLWPVVRRRSAA